MTLYECIVKGKGECGPFNFENPYALPSVEMINKDYSRATSSSIPVATLSSKRRSVVIHRDKIMSSLSAETLGKVLAYDAFNFGPGGNFEVNAIVQDDVIDHANNLLRHKKIMISWRDEGSFYRFFVYNNRSARSRIIEAVSTASIQGRCLFQYNIYQKANLPVYLSQARKMYGKRFELEFTEEPGWAFIHCPDADPEKLLKEIATATDVNVMDYAYQKYRELRFQETPPTDQEII